MVNNAQNKNQKDSYLAMVKKIIKQKFIEDSIGFVPPNLIIIIKVMFIILNNIMKIYSICTIIMNLGLKILQSL